MNNFFNLDGPFFTVLNRISDLIVLNVLWLICCIPIVTIGASTTAMFYVTLKMVNGEEGYVSRNFFKAFRENFLQSTIIWLIMLLAGALIVFNLIVSLGAEIRLGGEGGFLMNDLLLPISMFVALIYLMILMYLFPLQAKFVNKIRYTFKNAVLLSFRHLPSTIVFIAGIAAVIFLFTKFFIMVPILLLFGWAVLAYGYSFMYMKIFKLYIREEEPDAPSEEN